MPGTVEGSGGLGPMAAGPVAAGHEGASAAVGSGATLPVQDVEGPGLDAAGGQVLGTVPPGETSGDGEGAVHGGGTASVEGAAAVDGGAATVEAPALPAAFQPALLGDAGLDLLFRTARTRWSWRDDAVTDETLRAVYDALKFGPTSANSSPARFMFLRTQSARDRLRWTLSEGNVEKALRAPVVAIVAHEPKFYEDLPRLFPGADARGWFAHNDELAAVTAFRNGTLQGAYLMLAARAHGLSCGPMSGFDTSKVDTEFLIGTGWKSNFLVAMGYADDTAVGARAPRLEFDEACRLL